MKRERFGSVWDALEDTPQEAENMKLRATLMRQLRQHIEVQGWKQTETAEKLGVTQPRVSDLLRGKIDKFSLDMLVNMSTAAGLKISVKIAEPA
jgi:predicted XRE-type DNA-binding protein